MTGVSGRHKGCLHRQTRPDVAKWLTCVLIAEFRTYAEITPPSKRIDFPDPRKTFEPCLRNTVNYFTVFRICGLEFACVINLPERVFVTATADDDKL